MLIFLSSVLTASLLGSMHCVGMCGPLAIFASGAGQSLPTGQVVIRAGLYHLGRLLTYLIAGAIAGAIGSLVDAGGTALGFQLAAARVVGLAMIALGVVKLTERWWRRSATGSGPRPSRIGGLLAKLRPLIFRLPPSGRALVTGLLTTLLPCGWLYLFALIAAGTGSMLTGPLVMFAFWLGTVPALTALISGTVALSTRFRTLVPTAAAVLLILAGLFTLSGRGFAELNSLGEIRGDAALRATAEDADQVAAIAATPLPCCQEADSGGE